MPFLLNSSIKADHTFQKAHIWLHTLPITDVRVKSLYTSCTLVFMLRFHGATVHKEFFFNLENLFAFLQYKKWYKICASLILIILLRRGLVLKCLKSLWIRYYYTVKYKNACCILNIEPLGIFETA